MCKSCCKSFSWLKGAFLGGLFGSALVLLLTPYSGKELQSRIKDYVDNVQSEVHQAGVEKRLELETELELLRSGKK
ncbi:MAG: YtxH domain-containing protein [Anaerolineaceae bacterium]|jgi:gas vesicle protein|nr:YtxH domain-containing protein [Anaerolineaceae bacterium]MDD4043539.1 YtxH domain-containing protein [Anaerolineaceae bacterium]MDD4577924.1 YtxH domain-containing protein [Anaerolineaceae bacterium]